MSTEKAQQALDAGLEDARVYAETLTPAEALFIAGHLLRYLAEGLADPELCDANARLQAQIQTRLLHLVLTRVALAGNGRDVWAAHEGFAALITRIREEVNSAFDT